MFTKAAFTCMSREQRIAALEMCGVYLMYRNSDGYIVLLYAMNGYYVEVWQTISCDIFCVEIITDGDVVEYYLNELNIELV